MVSENIPPGFSDGEKAVFLVCQTAAASLAVVGINLIFGTEPWLGLVALVLAPSVSFVGFKWQRLKSRVKSSVVNRFELIAGSYRTKVGAVFLLVVLCSSYISIRLYGLQATFDAYITPRSATEEQAAALAEYLLGFPPHTVTVKVNPLDEEAREYWAQISNALKRSKWTVEDSTADGPPYTTNTGLCIHELGVNAKPKFEPPSSDPRLLLENALKKAGLASNCGGSQAAGEYKIFILIGHRPLVIRNDRLVWLRRWLMKTATTI